MLPGRRAAAALAAAAVLAACGETEHCGDGPDSAPLGDSVLRRDVEVSQNGRIPMQDVNGGLYTEPDRSMSPDASGAIPGTFAGVPDGTYPATFRLRDGEVVMTLTVPGGERTVTLAGPVSCE